MYGHFYLINDCEIDGLIASPDVEALNIPG